MKFHRKTPEVLKYGSFSWVHEQTLNCDVNIAEPATAVFPEKVNSTLIKNKAV